MLYKFISSSFCSHSSAFFLPCSLFSSFSRSYLAIVPRYGHRLCLLAMDCNTPPQQSIHIFDSKARREFIRIKWNREVSATTTGGERKDKKRKKTPITNQKTIFCQILVVICQMSAASFHHNRPHPNLPKDDLHLGHKSVMLPPPLCSSSSSIFAGPFPSNTPANPLFVLTRRNSANNRTEKGNE
jgi:hypothetical protein